MGLLPDKDECDMCGAKLEPEDVPVHLCKICQGMK